MSWSVCAGCNRTFTNLKYLADHLRADSHYGCYKAVYGSARASRKATNDLAADTRASKRRKALESVEAALRQSQEQAPHHSVTHDHDMSVFDFHNGDTEDEGRGWPDQAENGPNELPQEPSNTAPS